MGNSLVGGRSKSRKPNTMFQLVISSLVLGSAVAAPQDYQSYLSQLHQYRMEYLPESVNSPSAKSYIFYTTSMMQSSGTVFHILELDNTFEFRSKQAFTLQRPGWKYTYIQKKKKKKKKKYS